MKKTPEEIKQDIKAIFEDTDNNFDLINQLVEYVQQCNESYHSDKLSEVAVGELPSGDELKDFIDKCEYNSDSFPGAVEIANYFRSRVKLLLAKKNQEAKEEAVGFAEWIIKEGYVQFIEPVSPGKLYKEYKSETK